jgi:chemotaxis response regulator CheB
MSKTCIIVMRQDSLLNRALASILMSSKSDLKIVTSEAKDVGGLIAEVANLKPDFVILGESMPIAAKDMLGHLLMSYSELRVIVVSEDTNWIHVFQKRDVLMTRWADLLDVLQVDLLPRIQNQGGTGFSNRIR